MLKDKLLAAATAAPPGQQAYTTPGTYSWTCPAGVTSVSVVCVGGGGGSGNGNYNRCGGGGGGGLAYKNNIAVTPGTSYTIVVGAGGAVPSYGTTSGNDGGASYFSNASTVHAGPGLAGACSPTLNSGTGSGGSGGYGNAGDVIRYGGTGAWIYSNSFGGGAGAAGYGGTGGSGGNANDAGTAGAGGGGGGAGSGDAGPGGGGVGILGQGSNGSGGAAGLFGSSNGGAGLGGSGGGSGNFSTGGLYGGGGAAGIKGGDGAVRIIWPGNLRQFPSTRTADE